MTEYVIFTTAYLIALGITLIALLIAWLLRRRRWLRLPFLLIGSFGIAAGTYFFWYTHRPLPPSEQRTLFPGVEYIREVRIEPHPVMIHVVRIDLDTPDLRFLVTPEQPTRGWVLAGQTTSQFLEANDLQLAINGDFFDPWRDYGFWDYYPHVGDPVNVRGLSASDGEVYTEGYTARENYATVYFTVDNQVSFNAPPDQIANAISGNLMLLEDGVAASFVGNDAYLHQPHPRTAVAVDEAEETLIFIIVDGRQPSYSDGATIPELVDIIQRYGGYHALNLDGGGSVTLVIEREDGTPQVLNSPIHNRIPGRERPIANHLGVYVGR
jgi:hypothetical protein